MAARRVVIEFLGQDKSLSKTAGKVERETDGLGKKLAGFGKVAAVGLGAAAVGAGVAGKELFTLGGRLEQMGQKAATVFGPQIGQVDKWAKANAAGMGLTKREATGLAANFGDLLIPMGFTRDAAAKMSTNVVGLSGALAQWSGGTKTAAEVADTLSKAMLGERDELKSLGISITDADVKARLAAKGQEKLTGAALQQAVAIATQEMIFEKSTDAQAAFAKGGSPLLSAQAKIKAAFLETRDELAVRLVPAFGRLAGFIVSDVLPAIGNLGRWAQVHLLPPLRQVAGWLQENLVPALQRLAGFIGGVVIPHIRTLATGALEGLRSAFGKISKAIEENRPQLEKLVQGIGAVIKVVYERLGPILAWVVKNGFKVLGVALSGLIHAIGWLVDNVPPFVKKIGEIATAVGGTVASVVKFFRDLPGNVTKAIGDTAKTLVQKGKDFIDGLKNGIWAVAKSIDSWMLRAPVAKLLAPWYGAAKWLVANGKNLIYGFMNGVIAIARTIGMWLYDNVIRPVLSPFARAAQWLVGAGRQVISGLVSGFVAHMRAIGGVGRWLLTNVATPAIRVFGKAGEWLLNAGKNLMIGLFGGIVEKMKGIGDWIKRVVVDPIIGAVKTFFGISSPSKVFEGIGGFLVSGLFKGLSSGNVGGMVKRVFGGMPDALRSIVNKGLLSIGQLPQKALNTLGNVQEGVIPKGISTMPKAFQKTLFRGKLVNNRTAAMIMQAEAILGRKFHITQGSFSNSVKASGTTHSGGGAIDTNGPGGWSRAVAALRQVGFAAWHRSPSQGPWGHHIHAIAMGDPTASSSAKRQVRDYLAGGDGLGSPGPSGRLGRTPSAYRQGTPWVPDDQMAFLHKGEAVIPAEANRRRMAGDGTIANLTVNLVLDGKVVQQSLLRLKKLNGGLELGLA